MARNSKTMVPRSWFLAPIFIGIFLLGYGGNQIYTIHRLETIGMRTTGSYAWTNYMNMMGTDYYRFIDGAGEQQIMGAFVPVLDLGSGKVNIIYNPNNPSEAVVDSLYESMSAWAIAVFGAMILVSFAYILIFIKT